MLARFIESSTSLLKPVYSRSIYSQCPLCDAPCPKGVCPDCLTALPKMVDCCPICAEPQISGQVCGQCLQRPPSFERCIVPLAYKFPIPQYLKPWKLKHKPAPRWLFQLMVPALAEYQIDAIVPVPAHWRRTLIRGHNHTQELAEFLAKQLQVPVIHGLTRTRHTRTQRNLDKRQRQRNVRNSFATRLSVTGLRVLLVDDIMTTGSTLEAAARALKAAKCHSVIAACIAKTPKPAN